jgi:ABC-type histidine transport system ATPase subunit
MSSLLEVHSLHTLYGDSHVLHGVSFDIQKDQAVSLHVTARTPQWQAILKGEAL